MFGNDFLRKSMIFYLRQRILAMTTENKEEIKGEAVVEEDVEASTDYLISQLREMIFDHPSQIDLIKSVFKSLKVCLEDDGDYNAYGTKWKKSTAWCPLPKTELLCDMCAPKYEHILSKKFVDKDCSYCGKWMRDVYVCRRHSLCACSWNCAVELATKFDFPIDHFDAYGISYHM